MKRPFPIKSFVFFIVVLIASIAFMGWTSRRYPTYTPSAAESREAWRLQKLETERAVNYVENIKPYVPAK